MRLQFKKKNTIIFSANNKIMIWPKANCTMYKVFTCAFLSIRPFSVSVSPALWVVEFGFNKKEIFSIWLPAVTLTDLLQALFDKVQLLPGVDGQQVGSHHLTGQRDAAPVKGLLGQEILGPPVEHPGLTLWEGANSTTHSGGKVLKN